MIVVLQIVTIYATRKFHGHAFRDFNNLLLANCKTVVHRILLGVFACMNT